MNPVPSRQTPFGEFPEPPAPGYRYLPPFNLSDKKFQKLLIGVDLWHPVIGEGRFCHHGQIFPRTVLQMKDKITTLIKVSEFPDVDESLWIKPLQGMLISPIDGNCDSFKSICNFFCSVPRHNSIFECHIEPATPKHVKLSFAGDSRYLKPRVILR
jgi:hypothetical protein